MIEMEFMNDESEQELEEDRQIEVPIQIAREGAAACAHLDS